MPLHFYSPRLICALFPSTLTGIPQIGWYLYLFCFYLVHCLQINQHSYLLRQVYCSSVQVFFYAILNILAFLVCIMQSKSFHNHSVIFKYKHWNVQYDEFVSKVILLIRELVHFFLVKPNTYYILSVLFSPPLPYSDHTNISLYPIFVMVTEPIAFVWKIRNLYSENYSSLPSLLTVSVQREIWTHQNKKWDQSQMQLYN